MPKKSAKKKKSSDPSEPNHDPSWERSVIGGVWDQSINVLPDANLWPTWGALRERVLLSCKQIRVTFSPSLRDAFFIELVKLSPTKLIDLEFRGCPNLSRIELTPFGSCENLERLDLSQCMGLEYVFIQSMSLSYLNLSQCKTLRKALIHCPNLGKLRMNSCEALQTLMIWSDRLASLNLTGACAMHCLKLQCPYLTQLEHPTIKEAEFVEKRSHPPICDLALASL